MTSKSFVSEISENNLLILLDLYKKKWPENYITFHALNHALKNKDGVKIYSLNNDIKDGTFIYINDNLKIFHCNTLDNNIEKLKEILRCIGNFAIQFVMMTSQKLDPIISYLESIGNYHFESMTETFFYLDKTKALEIEISHGNDIVLESLTEDHAKMINNLWPHKFPGSINFVKHLIYTDFSVGAFSKSNELLAWIMKYPFGSVAILQVKEECLGRGLGKLVIKAMAKRLAENGIDSSATIMRPNVASRNIFKSIGFEEIYDLFVYKNLNYNIEA